MVQNGCSRVDFSLSSNIFQDVFIHTWVCCMSNWGNHVSLEAWRRTINYNFNTIREICNSAASAGSNSTIHWTKKWVSEEEKVNSSSKFAHQTKVHSTYQVLWPEVYCLANNYRMGVPHIHPTLGIRKKGVLWLIKLENTSSCTQMKSISRQCHCIVCVWPWTWEVGL